MSARNMIDMNIMLHRVELTYKELYELVYGDIENHVKLANIKANLNKVDKMVKDFKCETERIITPIETNFIGYIK